MNKEDIGQIAHLMRRAGFGATRSELEKMAEVGFDSLVDELLDDARSDQIEDDLVSRYHSDHTAGMGMGGMTANWLFRMLNSQNPLEEKVALFWHGVFATGYAKSAQGRVLMDQHKMFREHGLGNFKTLLIELSRDPSMILWLDNHDNRKGSINENYGRELLELFSMGVGNYSEDDIKACAQAFTGWTIGNAEYMAIRANNDSLWPYGRLNLNFEYNPDDHDNGEITFLGETGNFGGEDIIDIICRQEATGRFLARQMYSFFVEDEPPISQWAYTPPRDPDAIEILKSAYFDSGYDIRVILKTLFKSEFFRSSKSRYAKVKSPAELVVGVLKLTGEFKAPHPKLQTAAAAMGIMGQVLGNPPTVEGWHEGIEWVETGSLVERINFSSDRFSDVAKPGVREMIDSLENKLGDATSPQEIVQSCLDQMGAIEVSEETRSILVEHAAELENEKRDGKFAEILRMVSATPEFQRG